jgi:hypothetical protein
MEMESTEKLIETIKSGLLGASIIMLLVSVKLLLSYFVPQLKTPGELLLSGILLLIYTIKTFLIYHTAKQKTKFDMNQ